MISGILHLNSKTLYGMSARNVPLYLFRPFLLSHPPFIVGCSQSDTTANVLALVEPLDMTQRIPRGNLIRILGPCGDWDAEREAIHWTYRPTKPPKITRPLIEPDKVGRLDLRCFPTFNVDPPGCKDVDDCITFWNDSVVVSIADVGAWVLKNPCLQSFATLGQTLYDEGVAVRPLFPPELSEDLFSLRKDQDRFAVSIVYAPDEVPRMVRSIVRVSQSYSYDDPLPPRLRGECERIAGRPLENDSHKWIEALMIEYNHFVARRLVRLGAGLFRGHAPPDAERLERYQTICPNATYLAESSAVYQTFYDRTSHSGLDLDVYTHATSPIRRWADVHNQMVLMFATPSDTIVSQLNNASKGAKKHERDLFFLTQLRHPRQITGVVMEHIQEKNKTRIWIADWKRMISAPICSVYSLGTHLKIQYYLDMNQPTWKRRMVFRFVDTNYPESQSREPASL